MLRIIWVVPSGRSICLPARMSRRFCLHYCTIVTFFCACNFTFSQFVVSLRSINLLIARYMDVSCTFFVAAFDRWRRIFASSTSTFLLLRTYRWWCDGCRCCWLLLTWCGCSWHIVEKWSSSSSKWENGDRSSKMWSSQKNEKFESPHLVRFPPFWGSQ